MSELLPCPFCGSAASFEHLENGRWSVGCSDVEGASLCFGFQALTTWARREEAAKAWNTRINATPATPDVELREALVGLEQSASKTLEAIDAHNEKNGTFWIGTAFLQLGKAIAAARALLTPGDAP